MARRGAWRLLPTAAIVAGVVSAGLVAVLALGWVSLDGAHAAGVRTKIHWRSCGTRLQCGRVRVPLDWGRPHGPTISLAVIRYVPRGLKNRIGSLFVNFGGPGVAGVATLKGAPEAELEALSEGRFDVVSWDPRGTGESTHVRCFGSQRAQTRFWGRNWSVPTTNPESRRYVVKTAAFVKRCVKLSGRLLAHESTADTVRDLDYLRRVVGDRELTYLGVSYGTFIGQTYANLFPRRVRAIVLDGVVNPRTFTTSVRASISSGVANSDLVFAKFQSLCQQAGPARCALAGHGSVAARVSALLARIRRKPIPAPSAASPHRLSYGDLLIDLYGKLGNPALWPQLAADLEEAARGDGSSLEIDAQKAAPSYQEALVSATALQCADKPPPRQGPQAWPTVIPGLTRISRISGPLQGWWLWAPCASWPVASAHRYTGPWTASTRHPILVIGTRFDPQTPFANARRVARLLGHAVLLTYNGYGHTSDNDPSSCVTRAIENYLVALAAPRRGSICQPDHSPFSSGAHRLRDDNEIFTRDAPLAGAPAAPPDYRGVIAKLNTKIPELMKSGGTVGLTITLVDGHRTVWRHGFGWADRARKVPVTADTLFHIGSVSKTMSAAAVMQLVERGRVKLDAPLTRYVPGFSLKPRFHNSVITVRSALDHHSGTPGTLGNGLFTRNRPDSGYRAWLLKTLRTEYPQRRVNTAWAYNNSAFVLTQNLIEHVTGKRFSAYTRQHLFGPMGMRSTTYDDASVPAARLTDNYEAVPDDGGMRVIPKPREYVNGWAAGSVVSSATDMAAYLKTMIGGGAAPGGRILRASTLRQMITPQTNSPLDVAPFRMGLGWWVGDSALSWMGTVIHHAGHTLANDSDVLWLPRSKLGVFVSVNTHSPVDVEHQAAVLALGSMVTAKTGRAAPAPTPSPPIHVSTAVLRRAAGRYASAGGIQSVQVSGAALLFTRPHAPSITVTPRADGWYTDQSGSLSIKAKTVAGRQLLLGRTSDGAVAAIAERIPSTYHVPAAWRRRTGKYRAVNTLPSNYPGVVAHDASLTLDHGVLLWHAAPGVSRETSVLAPAGPRLAFTFGFAAFAVETDAGDGVVARKNTLTILGVTYRRTGK